MTVFLAIFAAAGLVILLLHLGLAFGILLNLKRSSARAQSGARGRRPAAEVIVAVRNEAANLGPLLSTLREQDEPGCLFLFVDDNSTDETPEILREFCASMGGRARLICSTEPPRELTGKQAALDIAFDDCRGEVLLFTDGDCILEKGWVRGIVDCFHAPEIEVVLGRVELQTDGSFLSRFQAFEQPLINQYNLGSAAMGLPTGCFGNNMAARSDSIRSIGGFSRIGYSVTEDAALLSALSKRPGARVCVATGAETVVRTRPKESWRGYINQHTRWNAGAFFSRAIMTRVPYSFIVTYLIICMLALPFGILDWRIALLSINSFLSIGLLALAGGLYAGMRRALYYARLVPYVVFFGFFYSYVSLRAILQRPFEWKGSRMGSRKLRD
jgi:biofilm PGA synthesis N-glycosyltransferase PgaC